MSNTVQETSPNSTSTALVSYPAPVYTWPPAEKPSVRAAYDAKQAKK